MTIGVCTLVSFASGRVFNYALSSYELAVKQAIELQKHIDYEVIAQPETKTPSGNRTKVYLILDADEVITACEVEVGTEVLEVE